MTFNLVPTYSVSLLECRILVRVVVRYFYFLYFTLGHFYFTKLLLPTLLATAKISSDGKARIVSTSSVAHEPYSGIDFNTFKESPARKKEGIQFLYAQSKIVRFLSPTLHRYSNVIIGKYPSIK
jgi:NAD(P)-dependent dehydrogenase (short-subunit alcohol dehydrogenase family)